MTAGEDRRVARRIYGRALRAAGYVARSTAPLEDPTRRSWSLKTRCPGRATRSVRHRFSMMGVAYSRGGLNRR